MHNLRILSYYLMLHIILLLAAGCSANQPNTFVGTLAPQSGVCEPSSRAVLVKRGHYIQFTPSQGVLILTGQVTPEGQLFAKADLVTAEHKPYRLTFTATLSGNVIDGSYVTPRCHYAVKLVEPE